MVYVEGMQSPAFRHNTQEAAKNEAARLARSTGKKAYILKALSSVEINDMKYDILEDEPDYDAQPF